MYLGYDQIETEQEEDQVLDEGEDRYLIFGNLELPVTPFLRDSMEISKSTISGLMLRDQFVLHCPMISHFDCNNTSNFVKV